MSTGVSTPLLRRSRHTSKPRRSGSITSSTTRWKGSVEARCRPVSPSAAWSTRWPSLVRRPLRVSRRPGSSSTSRIRLRTALLHRCGPLGLRRGRRQHERERAARTGRALDLDGARVRVHDPLHQAEAEPAPGYARGQGLPPAIEGLEDPALLAGRDAGAVIAHGDAHDIRAPGPARLGGEADPVAGGGVAGGGLCLVLLGAGPGAARPPRASD